MKAKPIFDIIFAFLIIFALGVVISTTMNEINYLGFSATILVFLWFGYRSLNFAIKKDVAKNSIYADISSRDSRLDLNPSYIAPFGFIVTFGLICQQLYLIDNSLFAIEISPNSQMLSISPWMIFAFDNLLRVVGFDFLESYNIQLINIKSTNYYVLTYIFIFKTILSLYFLRALTNLFNATTEIEVKFKRKRF